MGSIRVLKLGRNPFTRKAQEQMALNLLRHNFKIVDINLSSNLTMQRYIMIIIVTFLFNFFFFFLISFSAKTAGRKLERKLRRLKTSNKLTKSGVFAPTGEEIVQGRSLENMEQY